MKTNQSIKIAKIINEYTFIITAGIDQGVHKNDRFKIIQIEDLDVINPDTKEIMGTYKLVKGEIFAAEVYQNFSICKTDTIEEEVSNAFVTAAAMLGNQTRIVRSHRRLNVNEEQISGGFTPDPVTIGDIVERIEASH